MPSSHLISTQQTGGDDVPRLLWITLNMPLLRENLSKEDRREVAEAEVRQWLKDAGFEPSNGGWLVWEQDLGQLLPDEVTHAEVRDEAKAPPAEN